jgi:hypothetical protein
MLSTKPFVGLLITAAMALSAASRAFAQQVPDTEFKPKIERPAFAESKGPVVLVDEAHFNFHTASGRYQTFANLLRRDGYVVNALKDKFSKESLKAGQILVIANAMGERNQLNWSPPYDSAFTDEEIAAVREWVRQGGSLMLIVDHQPVPATCGKLARAFGIEFHVGYALDPDGRGDFIFKRADNSLRDHAITRGRTAGEKIDSVATFTGSAFQLKEGGYPLFILNSTIASFTPANGRQITAETPKTPVGGWLQGAVLRVGKGRVAVFGEAAMFSAQLAGPNKLPMGMNDPIAKQNPQFLLNVMHWLSGLLEK